MLTFITCGWHINSRRAVRCFLTQVTDVCYTLHIMKTVECYMLKLGSKQTNNRLAKVLNTTVEETKWQNIRVGHILLVRIYSIYTLYFSFFQYIMCYVFQVFDRIAAKYMHLSMHCEVV